MSEKRRKIGSSNPEQGEESRQRKIERQKSQRAEILVDKKQEFAEKRKKRSLEQKKALHDLTMKTKIEEHNLTNIPIQYDDRLYRCSMTIETDLVPESSNIVNSIPTTTTVSQIGTS